MKKAVVSVLGRDRVGIIAAVSSALAARNVNILDITQTVLQDCFTMVMLVDVSACEATFEQLNQELDTLGQTLEMSIRIQHEDIFDAMHRV